MDYNLLMKLPTDIKKMIFKFLDTRYYIIRRFSSDRQGYHIPVCLNGDTYSIMKNRKTKIKDCGISLVCRTKKIIFESHLKEILDFNEFLEQCTFSRIIVDEYKDGEYIDKKLINNNILKEIKREILTDSINEMLKNYINYYHQEAFSNINYINLNLFSFKQLMIFFNNERKKRTFNENYIIAKYNKYYEPD